MTSNRRQQKVTQVFLTLTKQIQKGKGVLVAVSTKIDTGVINKKSYLCGRGRRLRRLGIGHV